MDGLRCTMCGWKTVNENAGLLVSSWHWRHVASVSFAPVRVASCAVPMPWQFSHCTLTMAGVSVPVRKPPGCL